MKPLQSLRILVPIACVLTACGGGESTTPKKTTERPAAAMVGHAEAKQTFESLCFTCHGSNGHGDGPGAAAVEPKPRSFADAAWQDSVTDEHIKKVILFGGAGVGKSAVMPAQPQLKSKPEVLDALVKIVRGFRGNK